MKIRNAYLILPKTSSYAYKDEDTQRALYTIVCDWTNLLLSMNIEIRCFAEDELALFFLSGNPQVTWMSVVGLSDRNFITRQAGNLLEGYDIIEKTPVKEEYIKDALSRFRVDKNIYKLGDTDALKARLHVAQKRIKHTAERVLQNAVFIVCVDTNNNYCKIPEPTVGDGKLIVRVYPGKGRELYYYGGIPLEKEDFWIIVRSFVE